MALTWRRVKGSDLTAVECDANTDEIQGLLTRLAQFIASQTPGANNIPVLSAGGVLQLASRAAIYPTPGGGFGPHFGDKTQNYNLMQSKVATYIGCNCYHDGTNWRSIAAGAAYVMAVTQQTGGGVVLYTPTSTPAAADEIMTLTGVKLMTVPSADSWTTATLLNGLSASGITPAYRKLAATNNFQMKGRILNNTGSTIAAQTNIFAVPAGYRPGGVVSVVCPMTVNASWGTGFSIILYNNSTGYVETRTAIPNGQTVDLNPLMWFVGA